MERSIHALQQTAIHTLNHHRHDWMNDLQVLYGYIRMNKPDKIIQYVEKIRERMVMESRISKLGIPSLVLFFHSLRTGSQTLQLEVVVNGELNLSELPLQADKVSDTLIGLINAYRFGIKPKWGDAPKLIVTINADERALSVDFEFQGELNASEELYRQFKEKLAGSPLQPISMDPLMTRVKLQAELRRLNGGTSCL
ncbi:hypothetical protein GCM10010916_41290 [Paenibacillus abyssi]|uniref:SpoOB alpha-helical domain-containing protein n=1 Tax=Paenibacillus abyssi TaxID=1340531 RepID=A0A917G3P1_9BACL|nr:hypothetical protein GCM10010916_41290 [Paenibacillus abyssi]